jgi:ribosomal RNA-processing protein 9
LKRRLNSLDTMSSFFSVPGAHKKRKRDHDGPSTKRPARPARSAQSRPAKPQAAPKKQVERDEEISGSDSEFDSAEEVDEPVSESEESDRDETAAQKRLRLASQYLEKVRDEVEATGWDAEEIVREDPIASDRIEYPQEAALIQWD